MGSRNRGESWVQCFCSSYPCLLSLASNADQTQGQTHQHLRVPVSGVCGVNGQRAQIHAEAANKGEYEPPRLRRNAVERRAMVTHGRFRSATKRPVKHALEVWSGGSLRRETAQHSSRLESRSSNMSRLVEEFLPSVVCGQNFNLRDLYIGAI